MTAYRLVPNYDKPLRMLLIGDAAKSAKVIELLNRRSIVWWRAVPVVDEMREKRA